MIPTAVRLREALRSGSPDLACVPYAEFMGIAMERDGDALRGRLAYSEHLVGNPALPALHGGALGALLEMTAVCQLLYESATPVLPKVVTITVQYLRSARPVDTFARAVVTRRGRRVVAVRGEAWQEDPARPVATADAHFLIATAPVAGE